jgi:arsenite methyltransferase
VTSSAQRQTAEAFGYKWHQLESFEDPVFLKKQKAWLIERYGDVEHATWWSEYKEPRMLDAGCGAGVGALELFGERLKSVTYFGADISSAIDVAARRFSERGIAADWLQTDLMKVGGKFDVVFSEGVMHHTDSTEKAFHHLADLLKPGGRFLFYVYKKKGPIREFTDDYIREQLQAMTPAEAWEAMKPLTELGKRLGALDAMIDVPAIPILGIEATRMTVQRFVYWHVFKAYFDPTWSDETLNHVNFDWFAPKNAHRHTPEEVRAWCAAAGLTIERENVQLAGITIVARR